MDTEETLQTETSYISKQHRNRLSLTCFTVLLGLSLFIFYGYCWGLWGRHSLLLQYLFQCSCPAVSAEARYPEEVDVIVPACGPRSVKLSPSGRLLYVFGREYGPTSTYLLNLQTNEKAPFFIPEGSNYFLTDDLLFLSLYYGQDYEGGEYLLDPNTGEQYPIGKFRYLHPDAYVNGDVDLRLLAEALHGAKYVFLINDKDTVVALKSDFLAESEHNFITGWFDIPGFDAERVELFLKENNINYQTILPDIPDEVISQNGKFVARPDGIYLVDDEEKIVEGYSASRFYRGYSRKYFVARGWVYDGSGVIYKKFLNPCLIETSFFIFDDYGCYIEVPQPVLKLKVPEEYLSPAEEP